MQPGEVSSPMKRNEHEPDLYVSRLGLARLGCATPVVGAHFSQDSMNVALDCFFREVQLRGDLLVGQASANQRDQFFFPARQSLTVARSAGGLRTYNVKQNVRQLGG